MRIYVFFPIVLSLVLPAALAEESAKTGSTAMASAEGNYTIKDFHFADGETLPRLRIHYRTLGKPVSSSGCIQNAVLLLHGTSVTGDAFLAEGFRSAMFGPGQALDVSKYYYSPIRRLSAWPGLGCATDFQDGFSPKTKAARTWGTSVLAPTKRRGCERSDRDSAG
jgi:hypothetical protein